MKKLSTFLPVSFAVACSLPTQGCSLIKSDSYTYKRVNSNCEIVVKLDRQWQNINQNSEFNLN